MKHTEHEKNTVEPHQGGSVECDRTKPEQTQPNSQFDHELFLEGITLAGAYFESGVRDFRDYATAMINDLGANITPYLLSFWEGIRDYPGLDTNGMTDVYSSRRLYEQLLLGQSHRSDTSGIEKGLSPQMVDNIKKERKKYEDEGVIHNREMHHQILATWKRNSPQMTKRLKNMQVLEDMAFVSQERMWQAKDDYQASGISPTDAREIAEREHLMLEPEKSSY